jgi:signal transduction histidine kinase/ActR/RegA family two-component response regulator
MDSLEERVIAEEVVTDAKGNQRYFQTIKRPLIDSDGVARHVLGVATDITRMKRAEQERRDMQAQVLHAQKLESLGVLAGGIAHDFNNLLVGMLGNSDLALSKLAHDSPLRPTIGRIATAATRAADLCRQLLAYSGRGRFVLEDVNLSDAVREMNDLLGVSISKKATIALSLAEQLPPVHADPAQVRQVIMNLIINASDALEGNRGSIEIRTGSRNCSREFLSQTLASEAALPGNYCFLEVTDTGVGMTEEIQRKIFDPFFTTRFTGRGLGLAAVLGIVNGHGGAIQYISGKGQGTTARVFFPQSKEPSKATPRSASGTFKSTPGTVLIIDDEPVVREVLQSILESALLKAVMASGGAEALDIVRKDTQAFSVVLLDLTMPDMNGIDVLREIRRLNPSLPVVLLSGYNQEEALEGCDLDAQVGFLQKPFGSKVLLREVARVLGTASVVNPEPTSDTP